MKIFNIVADFNHINISSPRHINKLITEINRDNFDNETQIELNLEGCLTDYPNTPRLISFFLEKLAKIDGHKELTIKLDGLGNKEIYILYDIVLEGDFFGINEKIIPDQKLDEWHDRMNSILLNKNISLTIHYTPEDIKYQYGISTD